LKRKIVSGMMLALLLASMLTLALNIHSVKASGTIYIMADGSVKPDTAPISSLDKITYTFTDNIFDSIVVQRDNIVVDGAGYTVQGTGSGVGIDLTERSNITIKNLEIKTFDEGIRLALSSNNKVLGNNITANREYGIMPVLSSNISISGNNITNNYEGIVLVFSSNNTVSGNMMNGNQYNFEVYGDEPSHYIHTIDVSNLVDGMPVYYLINQKDLVINPITYPQVGYLALINSINITVEGLTLANDYHGLLLAYTNNSKITNSNITNNRYGIMPLYSSNNKIYHNNFIDNSQQARPLSSINIWDNGYPSGGNYWSDYTGVDLYGGPHQNETGSDGIGDTPYFIDENNQDNYPLMKPWGLKPSNPVEATQELIETLETWKLTKGTENSLKAKLKVAIHMLDLGKEDGAIRKLTAFINTVEILREKTLANEQADELVSEAQRIIDLIKG